MTRPRMLLISFSEIANDARVLKQVRAFSGRYELTTCGFGELDMPGVEHLRVDIVTPAPSGSIPRPLRSLRYLMTDAIDSSRNWRAIYHRLPYVRAAHRVLRGRRFDVALADDIDTVEPALRVVDPAHLHVDLHEYFPGIHDDSPGGRRQTEYLTWLLRRYTPRAASWTTVGRGIADAYRAFGLDCEVVTNATPRADLPVGPVGEPIRLVHSGNAQPSRQLEIVMRAVAASSADITLDLYLMPNDTAYLAQLVDLAGELGPRIRMRDPVPQRELVARLNEYDVGVHVLPPTSFNNENALPNKFFDYVQARLALLIGPSPEMSVVLGEHGLGVVAADFTTDAVRAALDSLTPDAVRGFKAAADRAADALSADSQVEVWVRAIERLAPTSPRA